jgi:hypothetical protein
MWAHLVWEVFNDHLKCREVTINKISSLTGKAQIGSHWTQVWGCIHWPHASSLLERGARLDRPLNWPAGPTDTSPLCSGKQLWAYYSFSTPGIFIISICWCEGESALVRRQAVLFSSERWLLDLMDTHGHQRLLKWVAVAETVTESWLCTLFILI